MRAEERRQGERRQGTQVVPGGRGRGPGRVVVLRDQLVEHHLDDQVDWHEVASAAQKIVDFARAKQERAYRRVRNWDMTPNGVA